MNLYALEYNANGDPCPFASGRSYCDKHMKMLLFLYNQRFCRQTHTHPHPNTFHTQQTETENGLSDWFGGQGLCPHCL